MTDEELKEIVERVLREELGKYGFREAEIRPAWEPDGTEYLDIRSYLDTPYVERDMARARASNRALSKLRDVLLGRGEERFPAVVEIFPEPDAA